MTPVQEARTVFKNHAPLREHLSQFLSSDTYIWARRLVEAEAAEKIHQITLNTNQEVVRNAAMEFKGILEGFRRLEQVAVVPTLPEPDPEPFSHYSKEDTTKS